MVIFCTFATANQIPYLHAARMDAERINKNSAATRHDLFANLWALARNPSYISVCGTWLVLYISGGVLAIVSTYTLLYAFHMSTEQIAIRPSSRCPAPS